MIPPSFFKRRVVQDFDPETLLKILLPLTKASRAVSATLEEILAQALQELAAVNDLNQLDQGSCPLSW